MKNKQKMKNKNLLMIAVSILSFATISMAQVPSYVPTTGQTVFTTFINQQNSYIDLSTWTGNGIYYVQLIDTQNNTIENRKIVIH